jgi:hypothetical protein
MITGEWLTDEWNEIIKKHDAISQYEAMCELSDRINADNKDKERLDWCQKYLISLTERFNEFLISYRTIPGINLCRGKSLREAIDQAMKEEAND